MGNCLSPKKPHNQPLLISRTYTPYVADLTKMNHIEFKYYCLDNYPNIQQITKRHGNPLDIINHIKDYNPIDDENMNFIYKYANLIYKIYLWNELIVFTTIFNDNIEHSFHIVYLF